MSPQVGLAILTAGVPSSQALPGFLITAPPSACVSTELGALAVWIQNHTKKKGGVKPAALGVCPRTKREVFGGTKIFI